MQRNMNSMYQRLHNMSDEMQHQIASLYNEMFPFDIRVVLSEWLDAQPWHMLEYDTPDSDKMAAQVVARIQQEINLVLPNVDNQALKFRLTNYLVHMSNVAPTLLVRHISQCLANEAKLIQGNWFQIDQKPSISPYDQITLEMNKLRQDLTEAEGQLRKLVLDQEAIVSLMQEKQNAEAHASQDIDNFRLQIAHATEKYIKQRNLLVNRYQMTLESLNFLITRVIDGEVESWKRGQQLLNNGVAYHGPSLDDLQAWCERLVEFLWSIRQQLIRAHQNAQAIGLADYTVESLFQMSEKAKFLLQTLVRSSFVIEKQPPQVMKTNTRFTATVRLLVGSKLNLYLSPPTVNVFIVSENQVAVLATDPTHTLVSHHENTAAGEILNNTGVMEYHSATGQLSVHFRNMQLKKIKRTEKKGTESVMDEKFALMFVSRFQMNSNEIGDVFARTFSLPVVVIVHGNQEPHAHATIIWDNAFAEPGRIGFHVTDKVPFIRIGEVLSQRFQSSVGKGLSEDNLRFLAAKALRLNTMPDLNTPITWSQFSKEPLPERNFTFWEWFYAILKVTKEHLRNLWAEGTIHGFIWRKQTEEMLAACQHGTFLLRFSDSEPGGLTVAWMARIQDGTSDECFMLQPFTAKDLSIRGLADRLNDLKYLTHLYPDIPKDTAFSKYYTPLVDNPKTNTGYVKPVLVTCVPGLSNHSYDSSYPNTPASSLQPHSPGDNAFDAPGGSQVLDNCAPIKTNGHGSGQSFELLDYLQDTGNPMHPVPIDFSNVEGYNYSC